MRTEKNNSKSGGRYNGKEKRSQIMKLKVLSQNQKHVSQGKVEQVRKNKIWYNSKDVEALFTLKVPLTES